MVETGVNIIYTATTIDDKIIREIQFYKFAAAIEVKNGITSDSQSNAAKQVADSVHCIEARVNHSIRPAGGIAHIRNKNFVLYGLPRGIQFLLESPRYIEEYVNPAVSDALSQGSLNGAADLVRSIAEIGREENIPLDAFFNVYNPRYWEKIGKFFPEYTSSHAFMQALGTPRGIIMENYVAHLISSVIDEGTVYVRVHCGEKKPDIDILVVAPIVRFGEAVKNLNELGIQHRLSRDLKQSIRKSR